MRMHKSFPGDANVLHGDSTSTCQGQPTEGTSLRSGVRLLFEGAKKETP